MGLVSTTGFFNRGCPQELILKLQKEGDYKRFIETGTFYGETTKWAAAYFKNVITLEASEEIFKKLNFNEFPNVTSVFGDSSRKLSEFLGESAIIYLDAHTSTNESFDSNPLIQELRLINDSAANHCIIVDDARYCTSAWDSFSYGELVDLIPLLGTHNRYVVIFDDMIIAVPRKFKELVDNYIHKKAARYWNTYVQELEEKNHPFRTAAKNWLTPSGLKRQAGKFLRTYFPKRRI